MIQDTNKPILIGGIGEPTWESSGRKTWQQGRRIYDTDGVAITISAVGGGYWWSRRTLYSRRKRQKYPLTPHQSYVILYERR